MNPRDYTKAVIDQLEFEGCKEIVKLSPSRFYATDDNGVGYDIKVKYCLMPRRLGVTDIHYLAEWMSKDRIDVLITNGSELTSHIKRYLDDNGIKVILGWNPDDNILEHLR